MSSRKLRFLGVAKDEQAVALTEFAITIPIVVLFFFAMLQYFAMAQASQLANYAAFVAARVYAVRASLDENNDRDALDKAKTAAAMVFAPIASPMPGEIKIGSSSVFADAFNQFFGNEKGPKLLSGFLMANLARLNPDVLGGSVTATRTGNPEQVDVAINYPQPIYLPGLMDMWNFVAGGRIYQSMKPLRQGLTGVPGTVLPIYEAADQVQSFQQILGQVDPGIAGTLGSIGSSLPTVLLPYANIRGKCSIGFSDWGKNQSDRPRLPARGNEPDPSGTTSNPEVAESLQNAQQARQAQQDYENAVNAARRRCEELVRADQELKAAQAIIDDPNASQQAKDDARARLPDLQDARDDAARANARAQADLETARRRIEQVTGTEFPGLNCSVQ